MVARRLRRSGRRASGGGAQAAAARDLARRGAPFGGEVRLGLWEYYPAETPDLEEFWYAAIALAGASDSPGGYRVDAWPVLSGEAPPVDSA